MTENWNSIWNKLWFFSKCALFVFFFCKEEKMKTKLCRIIRHQKKTIYYCLTKKIEEEMQECYTSKSLKMTCNPIIKHFYIFYICVKHIRKICNIDIYTYNIAEAAEITGEGALDKMKKIIMNHVQMLKYTMFDSAKDDMLTQLRNLMVCSFHKMCRYLWNDK